MSSKSLNQLLAENLTRLMEARQLTNKALAAKAGVAANTIANYKRGASPAFTARGKSRSAKLLEVERLAEALNVDPLLLLTDAEAQARRVQAIAEALVASSTAVPAAAEGLHEKRRLAAA